MPLANAKNKNESNIFIVTVPNSPGGAKSPNNLSKLPSEGLNKMQIN